MGEERRSTARVRAYRPVRLHKSIGTQVIETLTKDLALGGLRCVCPILFPVSTEVNIEFLLSTGDEPLTARGRTAWFRPIPQSEQFDSGITFLDMPQQNKRRLSAYLDRLSSQPLPV